MAVDMKPSEVLKKALELFGENGEWWVNDSPNDDQHCSVTAVDEASFLYDASPGLAIRALKATVGLKPQQLLSDWNDNSLRTWLEVKAAFEQAIKNCEAEGR